MKGILHSACTRSSVPRCAWRVARFSAVLVVLWFVSPHAWTQYPGAPPPAALTGPTLGASLRNAATATLAQAENVRRMADGWGRRANSGSYSVEQFQHDFGTVQFQFQMLRDQFNGLGTLALQVGSPRANNAVAELDAGLNIIAELPDFLADQFSAGSLDGQTISRTCSAFADAMAEWQRELKRNSARMDFVW